MFVKVHTKQMLYTIAVLISLCHNVAITEAKGKLIGDLRVVGGFNADELPTLAITAGRKLCAATLIHTDILVTAAHCAGSFISKGIWLGGTTSDGQSGSTFIEVERELPHPNFNNATEANDIMLVKLRGPAAVAPQKINFDLLFPSDGTDATVIGYGATVEGGASSFTLQEAEIPIVSFKECDDFWNKLEESTQICTGLPDGSRDTCQGDSGGPLIVNDVLVGIVSFGLGCGRPNTPGVYARTSGFEEFITSGICDLSDIPPDSCFSSSSPRSTPVPVPASTPVDIPVVPPFTASSNSPFASSPKATSTTTTSKTPVFPSTTAPRAPVVSSTKSPTKAPVGLPRATPIVAPQEAPEIQPTTAPTVNSSTRSESPFLAPSTFPLIVAASVPVSIPLLTPLKTPVLEPVSAPVKVAITPTSAPAVVAVPAAVVPPAIVPARIPISLLAAVPSLMAAPISPSVATNVTSPSAVASPTISAPASSPLVIEALSVAPSSLPNLKKGSGAKMMKNGMSNGSNGSPSSSVSAGSGKSSKTTGMGMMMQIGRNATDDNIFTALAEETLVGGKGGMSTGQGNSTSNGKGGMTTVSDTVQDDSSSGGKGTKRDKRGPLWPDGGGRMMKSSDVDLKSSSPSQSMGNRFRRNKNHTNPSKLLDIMMHALGHSNVSVATELNHTLSEKNQTERNSTIGSLLERFRDGLNQGSHHSSKNATSSNSTQMLQHGSSDDNKFSRFGLIWEKLMDGSNAEKVDGNNETSSTIGATLWKWIHGRN